MKKLFKKLWSYVNNERGGGATFTPKQQNWRVYRDDGAEPTTAIADENTIAVDNTAGLNNYRIRVTIIETGGKAGTLTNLSIQYSTDDSAFTAMGSGNHWNWANGQATNGNSVTTNKLTDTTGKGVYDEDGTPDPAMSSSTSYEYDFCIAPTATATLGALYYFRCMYSSTSEVVLNTGETHPQIRPPLYISSLYDTGTGTDTGTVTGKVTALSKSDLSDVINITDTDAVTGKITALSKSVYDTVNISESVTGLKNPVLLIHFNGADGAATYTAETGQTVTFWNDAQLDTAEKRFGSASLLVDGTGTGDFVTVPDNADWNFGTNDFTIDFWVNFSDLTIKQELIGQWTDVDNYWEIHKEGSAAGNDLQFFWRIGAVDKAGYVMAGDWSVSTNTWYHIAVVRSGTSMYLFINGVVQSLTTATGVSTNDLGDYSPALHIGGRSDQNYGVKGWIDECRIHKGVALWTADFDPPAKESDDPNGAVFKYDNITVSESVTASVSEPALTQSIYDTINISESVTGQISALQQSTLYDSITITDTSAVTGKLTALNLSTLYDLTTATDTSVVTGKLTELKQSALYDTATVTDTSAVTGQISAVKQSATFDTVNITDTSVVTGKITALSQSIYDLTNISEDVTGQLSALLQSIYDSITISESITTSGLDVGESLSKEVYDLTNVSEDLTASLTALKSSSLYDLINVSESITSTLTTLLQSISDLTTIAESTTQSLSALLISLTDYVRFSDAFVSINNIDNINISEFVVGTSGELAPYADISDNIAISENVDSRISALQGTTSDTTTITDTSAVSARLTALSGTTFDNISISEYTDRLISALQQSALYDTINVSEYLEYSLSGVPPTQSTSDNISISEYVTGVLTGLTSSLIDNINVSESITKQLTALLSSLSDNINISESITTTPLPRYADVYDGIIISEDITANFNYIRIDTYDSIEISDEVDTRLSGWTVEIPSTDGWTTVPPVTDTWAAVGSVTDTWTPVGTGSSIWTQVSTGTDGWVQVPVATWS